MIIKFRSFINRHWAALILIGIGVACLAIGIWRGEDEIVLRKAIYICLECIGIG